MTPEKTKQPSKKQGSGKKTPERLLFKCPFCEQSKPIDQMLLMTRFFPPLVVCRECEARAN